MNNPEIDLLLKVLSDLIIDSFLEKEKMNKTGKYAIPTKEPKLCLNPDVDDIALELHLLN